MCCACSSVQACVEATKRCYIPMSKILTVLHLAPALLCAPCRELCAAAATGPGLADMFGRIMVSVDEDIISLDIPR